MPDENAAQFRRADEVERLQRLLDGAPSFIVVIGRDMRFYVANRAYREMIGQDEVVGRTFDELFPPALFPQWAGRIGHVLDNGEPISGNGVEVHLPGEDGKLGRRRILDFAVHPIVEDEVVIAALLAGNDVTAQHQAEARLRESEERFRLIADSAPVPIWVSNPNRTRDFINKAYIDFVGLDYDAAARLDWRLILHPDDQDRVVAESIAGEASLQPFSLEARYRNAQGEWRWIRSISQPRWAADGEVSGFIGVAHDVTEAKQAEAALRELNETLEHRVAERTGDLQSALDRLQQEIADRERAEEALRQSQKMEAVGQLTGGIAHDFNNLLTPIIGGLELILRHLDDPRLLRIGQAALDSGRRGAKLATQLLAFSRLQRIAITPVDANRVIREMGEILRHSIGPTIEIVSTLDPAAGHALCDANQLENAVLNLAINGRDAMPDGGRLIISTAAQREPDGPDLGGGDYVRITVEDDGHGMPAEVLARAVEPFFSTKPVGKGTGLGLAQVYGIAQQSGGTVRIESTPGLGTRVSLLLPQVAPIAEAAPPPVPVGAVAVSPTPMTILIVDDDPEVRAFLADAVETLGHAPLVCDGPEACLELLDTARPDLVLIDFAMPGMNGAELAEAILARRPGQPLAFVTGYAESEQIAAVCGSEVPVLRKPFSLEQLAALLAREGLKNR